MSFVVFLDLSDVLEKNFCRAFTTRQQIGLPKKLFLDRKPEKEDPDSDPVNS